MHMRFPIRVLSDLTVRIGDVSARITPREWMHLAERLIRTATRKMVHEAARDVRAGQAPKRK
jgi:hypothetical protein